MTDRTLFLATLACVLGACSQETEEPAAAPTSVPTQATSTSDFQLSEIAQQGQRVYLRCRSCHTLEAGGANLVGPNLHGIFGAQAGKKEGFAYSAALLESGITWDRATMDAWIEAPQTVIPGNKMAFAGLRSAEDREAVIQYLEETTSEQEGE